MMESKNKSLPIIWNNEQLIMIIDEGAEVNCVDAAVVKRVGCQIFPTHQSASAAGKSKLNIFGTLPDNTISRSVFENVSVPINIGDALVVQDLGVDLLLGEPGKCRNKINTISDKKLISAQLDDKILHTPYFKLTSKSFYLCRAPSTTTIYPGQHYQVNLPFVWNESLLPDITLPMTQHGLSLDFIKCMLTIPFW